jgi:hypothetical protein
MIRAAFLLVYFLIALFGAYCVLRPRTVIAAYRRAGIPTYSFGYEVLVWRICGMLLVASSAFFTVLVLSE